MPRTRFVEHRGTPILLHDFSYLLDSDDALAAIAEARAVMSGQPPRSVRTLVNVEGGRFDVRVSRALGELAAHNRPYVVAAAVVGVAGLQKVVLTAVSTFSSRHFATFHDVGAAKDWLIKQEV